MDPPVTSNMIFTLKSVPNHPAGGNKMLMGCELEFGTLIDFEIWRDEPLQRLETLAKFEGHTSSVRKIEYKYDFT